MSGVALALREVRYVNIAFWRNPPAAFFTFFFPLLFMLIFNVIFGGDRQIGDGGLRVADFYTPGIIVFSVITATYTNIAMTVSAARDAGILKRVRGTPLPTLSFLAGRILHAILIALILTAIVALFGSLVYAVHFPWERLPALVVTLAVGAASFCALGMAIAGVIPNADAAPAIVQFSILPLNFISNVFIDVRGAEPWIDTVSKVFPIRHFADAMLSIYNDPAAGSGFAWNDLLVIAAWGVAGLVIALRFFAWEPRR